QKHSITNIESRSLSELNTVLNTNLADAIANIPSVYNLSTGVGISKPVIRGLSGMRVVTYLNGLRIENQQWGGDHGMGITENGIGNVEIIKGPSSVLYGVDALGGVVYFTDEPYAAQNSLESFVESQFETNSLRTKNFAGVKWSKEKLRINIFGNYSNNADYQLPNGNYATNSRFYENNVKTAIGYNKGNWVMNLRYNYVFNRIGLPGHTHDSITTPESFQTSTQKRDKIIPVQLITNHYALLENTFYFTKSDLKIWTGYTSNNIIEHEEKVTIAGIDMTLSNYPYNVRWRNNLKKTTNLIIGAQGMFQENNNDNKAEEILIPNSNLLDNGVYSLIQMEKNNWNIQTGIRFDNRNVNSVTYFNGNAPFSSSYNGFNYSAGAVKSMNKYTFRANISSGFRPPHLSELLANGIHHANLRYEVGDKNLQSEHATQMDISAEYASDHISIIANPFYTSLQDYIYLEPQNTSIDGFPVFHYKQANSAQLYGGDLGVHYHPHFAHQLHLEHSVSYIQAEDETGTPLPLIPQTRFNTTVRVELASKGRIHLENISVQHLYFLPQNRVVTYETTSPAYQLIHVGANLKLNFKQPIYIKVGVRNLLNEAYIDHLSRLKNIGLEAPARNFYISARIHLKHTNKKSNQ
ncbi:MAG: TonB-dependent receptor plug domain-containing protein, partial [Bacteroidia bacterium]